MSLILLAYHYHIENTGENCRWKSRWKKLFALPLESHSVLSCGVWLIVFEHGYDKMWKNQVAGSEVLTIVYNWLFLTIQRLFMGLFLHRTTAFHPFSLLSRHSVHESSKRFQLGRVQDVIVIKEKPCHLPFAIVMQRGCSILVWLDVPRSEILV